ERCLPEVTSPGIALHRPGTGTRPPIARPEDGLMGYVCETRLRVRYAETDQMGVVYYANYLVWMRSEERRVGKEGRCREASERRHTRFKCDWSSDVCSSDLRAVSPCGTSISTPSTVTLGIVGVLLLVHRAIDLRHARPATTRRKHRDKRHDHYDDDDQGRAHSAASDRKSVV